MNLNSADNDEFDNMEILSKLWVQFPSGFGRTNNLLVPNVFSKRGKGEGDLLFLAYRKI